MESFISKYMKGQITDEEIGKHVLTEGDIQYIKRNNQNLEKMLKEYKASILNRKDLIEKIKEELEINSKIAKFLSLLGKSYQTYIEDVNREIAKSEGNYLETNLYIYYRETLDFIIYLLSRKQQNYSFSNMFQEYEYANDKRMFLPSRGVDLVVNEDESFKPFSDYYKCRDYLNYLYGKQKSFIVSTYSKSLYNDDNIELLYHDNEMLLKSKNVGFLGRMERKTFCYIGDDIFREIITKLMLFTELHGLCIGDINEKNKEDYARAIESMDINSYLIALKNYPGDFTLARKR